MLDDSKEERTHLPPARETHHEATRHHCKSKPVHFFCLNLMEVRGYGQSRGIL